MDQLAPRRQGGKLLHDEFEFAPGRMLLVIPRRVARAQIELVFVPCAPVCPRMVARPLATVEGLQRVVSGHSHPLDTGSEFNM
jgi:hypothetical protein